MSRRLLIPRESGLFRFAELWVEDDALLYVHSSRFTDRYARYRFRDIQALVLTEFPVWSVWRAWWLGGSLFFTALLLLAPPGAWKLFALPPGISLGWAAIYLLRGPRCRLVLHTAVSTVTLEAVRTMAQAQAVVPELRRLTESVQGRLAADGMTVEAMPAAAEEPKAAPRSASLLLQVLYSMAVLHALLLAGFFFSDAMDQGLALSGTLLLSEIVLGFMAAMRWRSAGVALTVLSVVVIVAAIADGGVLIYSAIQSFGGLFEAVSRRSGVKPEDVEWVWLKPQTVGRASWHAVAGLAGWVLLLIRRGRQT